MLGVATFYESLKIVLNLYKLAPFSENTFCVGRLRYETNWNVKKIFYFFVIRSFDTALNNRSKSNFILNYCFVTCAFDIFVVVISTFTGLFPLLASDHN